MSSQALKLRRMLEQRFPDAMPLRHRTSEVVATGISALDRVLPGGGLPRGRLVAWWPGGGARALLWWACGEVMARGQRAAWVDASGISGAVAEWEAGWCGRRERLGPVSSPLGRLPVLVHPAGPVEALACTEELLTSGGFGLLVLAGVSDFSASAGVRLSRAAQSGGGAFVLVGQAPPVASLRVAARIVPEGYRWRRDAFGDPAEVESVGVDMEVAGLGLLARTEFRMRVVSHEVCLSLEPGLADRRSAAG